MADNERNELNRREFLRKAAITGAAAWAIPVVQTVAATPASAQQTYFACVHSPTQTGGPCPAAGNCKAACGTAGQAECGKDCGGGCEVICADCIGTGPCNPCPSTDYCDPACFNVTSCEGSCTVEFVC